MSKLIIGMIMQYCLMNNASKTPNCSRVKAAESPHCPQVPVLYGLILNITMFRIRPIVSTVVSKYVGIVARFNSAQSERIPFHFLHLITSMNVLSVLLKFPLTNDIELFILIKVTSLRILTGTRNPTLTFS